MICLAENCNMSEANKPTPPMVRSMDINPQIASALIGAAVAGAFLFAAKLLDNYHDAAKLKVEHERQDVEWLRSELVKTYSDAMLHLSKLDAVARLGGDPAAAELHREVGESQACLLQLMAYSTDDGTRNRIRGAINSLSTLPSTVLPKDVATEISVSARGAASTVQSVMETDKRIGRLRETKGK
jgi:hypothetical protein